MPDWTPSQREAYEAKHGRIIIPPRWKDCRMKGGRHYWVPNFYAAKLPDQCAFCEVRKTSGRG